jgi:hypothetical protein
MIKNGTRVSEKGLGTELTRGVNMADRMIAGFPVSRTANHFSTQ